MNIEFHNNQMLNRLLILLIGIAFVGCGNSIQKDSIKETDLSLCKSPSFSNYFGLPSGINGYFDFDEGVECSKLVGKPCLIYFNSFNSVESREVDVKLLLDKEIQTIIAENYVFINLVKDCQCS